MEYSMFWFMAIIRLPPSNLITKLNSRNLAAGLMLFELLFSFISASFRLRTFGPIFLILPSKEQCKNR